MKTQYMVVDDNPFVCETTARLVGHITGAQVRTCQSGDEALRIFKSDPAAFGCVITDFEMSGIDGLELGRRLHSLAPGVKLVLVSGSMGAFDPCDIRLRDFHRVIAKPYRLDTLREALTEDLPAPDNIPAARAHGLCMQSADLLERFAGIRRAAF